MCSSGPGIQGNEIAGFFGQHGRRGVGIRTDEAGKHAAVADPKAFEASNPQPGVDHAMIVRAHPAGSNRVIGGSTMVSHEGAAFVRFLDPVPVVQGSLDHRSSLSSVSQAVAPAWSQVTITARQVFVRKAGFGVRLAICPIDM